MRFEIRFALLFGRVEFLILDSISAPNKVDHLGKTGLPGYLKDSIVYQLRTEF